MVELGSVYACEKPAGGPWSSVDCIGDRCTPMAVSVDCVVVSGVSPCHGAITYGSWAVGDWTVVAEIDVGFEEVDVHARVSGLYVLASSCKAGTWVLTHLAKGHLTMSLAIDFVVVL